VAGQAITDICKIDGEAGANHLAEIQLSASQLKVADKIWMKFVRGCNFG
jgi:hypothetical protein